MILKDLYELQGGLMENIDYQGADKMDKMFTATFTELGEFAQEWRGFKYWSKDQEPRTEAMLVEYVDVLHFLLEWGITLDCTPEYLEPLEYDGPVNSHVISGVINDCFMGLGTMRMNGLLEDYETAQLYYTAVIRAFILLGHLVGLNDEQIRTAYIEKNNVNHKRQNTGY